ncbi:hypothetical protein MMC14_000740 [Varicellaria rhodocarpa]|nr:hypothetical protein [Varicellaria rhodocarpa]
MSFLRNPFFLLGTYVSALTAGSTYLLRAQIDYIQEEHEARMDELEGTLRGHIGLIEEALDRLEGTATEADRGKKMNEYYGKRGRDEKQKK